MTVLQKTAIIAAVVISSSVVFLLLFVSGALFLDILNIFPSTSYTYALMAADIVLSIVVTAVAIKATQKYLGNMNRIFLAIYAIVLFAWLFWLPMTYLTTACLITHDCL